jgi:hypothetical protein
VTKNDYIALARAVSTFNDPKVRAQACAVLGQVLKVDNPLFDFPRFAQACGVSPETRQEAWLIRKAEYWSNVDVAWGPRESATRFTKQERDGIERIGHMPTEPGACVEWEQDS